MERFTVFVKTWSVHPSKFGINRTRNTYTTIPEEHKHVRMEDMLHLQHDYAFEILIGCNIHSESLGCLSLAPSDTTEWVQEAITAFKAPRKHSHLRSFYVAPLFLPV